MLCDQIHGIGIELLHFHLTERSKRIRMGSDVQRIFYFYTINLFGGRKYWNSEKGWEDNFKEVWGWTNQT